jgi:hypothetical protein
MIFCPRLEMEFTSPSNYRNPLDLLRRFVPTPLRTRFRFGRIAVLVDTNDFSLLPMLPLDSASEDFDTFAFRWKLVRDSDVFGHLQEPLVLHTGELTIVGMGPACLLGLDRQRRELFGFIGADVGTKAFQEFLVPFLCRLSTEATEPNLRQISEGINEDAVDA